MTTKQPTMQALTLDAENRTAILQSHSIPSPGSGGLLIKIYAIALNPVDALYTANPLGSTGRIVGSDFAGTVVKVVPSNEASDGASFHAEEWKEGDRVAGFLQGACSVNDRPGAFAEFVTCPADLVWRVPESLTFEQAASVSLCGLTAAQGVYGRLGLAAPWTSAAQPKAEDEKEGGEEKFFLIYGASTSVALYAAQLVRASTAATGKKITLIGVASPARFPLLKAKPYSYHHLLSYHSAAWHEEILALTGGKGVDWAFDCICEGETVATISHLLGPDRLDKLAIIRSRTAGAWDPANLRPGAEPKYGAVWSGLGVEVQYQGFTLPADEEERRRTGRFYQWLGRGELEANPVRLMPGGLERVVGDGFVLMGSGKMQDRRHERKEEWMRPVGGEKVVYRIG